MTGDALTDADLAAIEARWQATTPGRWVLHGKRADYEDDFVWAVHDQSPHPYHSVAQQLAGGYGILAVAHVAESEHWPEDRAFIAAAHQDVPTLLAEVRRLRAALAAAP